MTPSDQTPQEGRADAEKIGRATFHAVRALVVVVGVVGLSTWLDLTVWPGLAILYIVAEASRR